MKLIRITASVCVLMLVAWLAHSPQAIADTSIAQPALELPDLDGKKRKLADWRGKLLLVNFWATWCAPCQAEIPSLMRYQKRYGSKGLQIIGVGMDDLVKLRNFRNSFEINYPVLVADPDRSMGLLAEWGNSRGIVPYTVLLDEHGRLLEKVTGVVDDEVMEDLVMPYLNAPPSELTSQR